MDIFHSFVFYWPKDESGQKKNGQVNQWRTVVSCSSKGRDAHSDSWADQESDLGVTTDGTKLDQVCSSLSWVDWVCSSLGQLMLCVICTVLGKLQG